MAQIIHIFQCKSTGSLSLIPFLLIVPGNLGRLYTVIMEISEDYLFLYSVLIAFALNSFIVIQFFIYWNSDKEKVKDN